MLSHELGGENIAVEGQEMMFDPTFEDIVEVSPELAATLRPQLQECLEDTLRVTAEPQKRAALEVTTSIVDWMLFGRNEPLPLGLVIAVDDDQSMRLALDSRLDCWMATPLKEVSDSYYELRKHNLGAILNTVRDFDESREAEFMRLATEHLKQTPEYTIIAAFDTPAPLEDVQQPLSPFLKAIRYALGEDDIRKKFGIDKDTPIPAYSDAGKALGKLVWQIDEETMPRKQEQSGDEAVIRARNFFTPFIKAAFAEAIPEYVFDHIGFNAEPIGCTVIYSEQSVDDPNDGYPSGLVFMEQIIRPLMRDFSKSIGRDTSLWDTKISTVFTEVFLEELFDNRSNRSFHEVIDLSLKEWAGKVQRDFRSTTHQHMDEDNSLDEVLVGLRQPDGAKVSKRYLDGRNEYLEANAWRYALSSRVGFSDVQSIMKSKSITLGRVQREPWSIDTSGRLIQFQTLSADLAGNLQPNVEVLTLQMPGLLPTIAPHVPGMKLIANFYDEYSFVVSEEGDPYAVCNVPVPAEKQERVADMYRQIGLGKLADDISGQRLTVDKLVEYIRSHSDYYAPAEQKTYPEFDDSPFQSIVRTESLSDFAPLVQNGRLMTQCSTSDAFLNLTMSEIFGQENIGSTRGYGISDKRITEVGHVQTTFTYDNRIYILDATPAASDSDFLDSGFVPAQPLQMDAPIAVTHRTDRNLTTPAAEFVEEVDKFTRLMVYQEGIIRNLEQYLTVTLRARDHQDLQEKLVQHGTDDLLRKTISTFYAVRRQAAGKEELSSLESYVELYKNATADDRHRANLVDYNAAIVDEVHYAVKNMRMCLWGLEELD